jgi:hypothetical protein
VIEFIWIDFNLDKIYNHNLSADEVEFAWHNRQDLMRRVHPVNGEYWESLGECPNGRIIRIIWRYNEPGDTQKVFVITPY